MNKKTLLICIFLSIATIVNAAKENKRLVNNNINLEKIKKVIELQQKELNKIEDTKKQISTKISLLEDKLLYMRQLIGQLNIEYKNLLRQTEDTERKLATIKEKVEYLENEIKQNNIYILENYQMLKIKALIFTDDYHQILKNLDLAEYMNSVSYKKILTYQNLKAAYEEALNNLNIEKQKLISIKNKRDLMAINFKNEQVTYKHILSMLYEDTNIKNDYIKALKKKKDTLEKEFRHIKKNSSFIASNSIVNMKGKLLWPIKGKVLFDNNTSIQNSLYNNGIRILPINDENVRAVFNGVIQYINWIKGYGNIVIIAHDSNYFTVYANLDLIGVQLNETVRTGETIGKINIEGNVGKSYIYFELREKDKALNPLNWLKKEA
jgi:septal ring factor EnvC (AmiA/AmiB activator)